MCRYILPLLADTITPVQQGIFVTWGLCQIQSHTKHSRPRPRTWIARPGTRSCDSCHALGSSSANVRSASPPRERGTVFLLICAPHSTLLRSKRTWKHFLFRVFYSSFWLNSCVTFALLHCRFLFLVYCIFVWSGWSAFAVSPSRLSLSLSLRILALRTMAKAND